LVKDRSNVLIVCHGFPPNPGVAGRRWAKFAKYLHKSGYNVQVIASEKITDSSSNWNNDIEGIPVEYLPYKFPKVITLNKSGVLNKLKYRFWLFVLKILNRGNFYDRSFFWKRQITKKISHYIETKNINTVIVTAGPFFLSYYVTLLKNKYPGVKFIVDFRDLWTGDSEITSFSTLSKKRILHEQFFERRTILQADVVLTVGEQMSTYFDSLAINKQVYTLPNGFDEDDFDQIEIEKDNDPSDLIKLVFAGTLYINLEYILIPFFEALVKLREENLNLFNKLRFEFYGTFPESYKVLVNKYNLNEIISYNEKLPLNKIYSKIKNAKACLLFLNDVYNFALSTKFCEYISQNKKIIVVSNKGQTSEFITSNQLGYWISPKDPYKDLLTCLGNLQTASPEQPKSTFDVSFYSLNSLTKSLIEIIDADDYCKVPCYKNKNLLLTFDYELFLGRRSGTVLNSIIIPTNKILDILKQYNLKNAIFFVDTVYIKRLEENLSNDDLRSDYNMIIDQLSTIIESGHFIFPHIHPHWLYAKYNQEIKQWNLNDLSKYRFSLVSNQTKVELFEHSFAFIKMIQKKCNVHYEVDSFRAGGWCIQPFSDFKELFEKFGIKNDFSVLKGFSMEVEKFYYNFENVPNRPIYYFDSEIEKSVPNGKFKEYSITYVNNSNFKKTISRILNRIFNFSGIRSLGDGVSVEKTEESVIADASFNFSVKKNLKEMVSVDYLNEIKVREYENYLKSNNFIHFISHPKMLSEHSLMNFSKYLHRLTNKYKVETDYRKMY
jgi:hypothetical protein